MPPPPHTKPENVLKRAQELVGVGQPLAAHALLHEHVTSKRTRNNPIASIEPVMLLFVELSVDLRKGKAAKDGLYSYKNTAQNTNIGTIELVLSKFIELAEQKVTDAQSKAEEVQSSLDLKTSAAGVDDLEASETPESILLSTVSGEQSKDRTDRAIVTPWLKFLWETYRTVLEILKNNARLEEKYQSTAHRAFQFCSKYARKTEFRRLCELLRNHLQNAAKYHGQVHAIDLSNPDTLQRHLDTRFQQLNVAVELELWQEAFRSIEDIHMLLNLSKRPARNIMMANYFEKLATIFLVSENYLFHAAAYSRYYNLLRTSQHVLATGQGTRKDNPAVTDAEITSCASFVMLSALSIPVISTQRSRGALVDVDEARKNKNTRLTSLLGMTIPPSRASILKDALAKGLLKRARPEIRELYNILEVDFHPLSICQKISPILAQIGSDPELGKYVLPLQQVILTRLFQQLSQVYESVELEYVLGLARFPEPFQVSRSTVEKFIMNGCKKGDLAIRIDHSSGIITFDSDVFSSAKALHPGSGSGSAEGEASVQRLQSTPAEIVRSQLTRLAKTLFVTCQYVDPTFSEDQLKARAAALQRAEQGANKEHLETLERRAVIEKKKQSAATALAQKTKEEETRKRLKAQEQQQAELTRLEQEQRERDQRRLREQQLRVQREEAERQLKELKHGLRGVDINELNLDEMDTGRIRALKLAQLEKEKNELGERLRTTGRRIDHLERAFRREEISKLPADYTAQKERDRREWEVTTEEQEREAKEKHVFDLGLKRRLTRLVEPYETFRDRKQTERRAEFDKRRAQAHKELEQKKQARVQEFKDRKARERREAEERERRAKEEEERQEREAEEQARRDEEKKAAQAKMREEQEAYRKKQDEIAERQRQREAEVEARRTRGGPPPAAASEEPSRGPPKVASKVGGGGGWREREAAKRAGLADGGAASASASSSSPAPAADSQAAPAPRQGGYVPPHMRNKPDGASAASPPARPAAPLRRDTPERTSSPFERNETPPPAAAPPPAADGAPQRYRPGAFRARQQQS
ncbi:MAG: hypothetical protein Q9162_000121 [Coniocarpon cinnabarinum]